MARRSQPGVQLSHAVWPDASWKEPATHGVHVSCRAWLLYVPGAHGVAASEPTLQYVPTPHSTHWLTLLITTLPLGLCVPPGHGSAAAAPSAQ